MIDTEVNKGLAVLSFNMKDNRMNIINESFMHAFSDALALAIKDDNVVGIILTSKHNEFVAGADIRMFSELDNPDDAYNLSIRFNNTLRILETCGKPVVAALNGSALGGGYEIALACHHRIALNSPHLKLGFPEVKLGLMPGGGGTQRLPRLIGLQKGIQFILEGTILRPEEALEEKLVDELADNPEELIIKAKDWITKRPIARQPWDQKNFKIPGGGVQSPAGSQILSAAIGLLRQKTFGNYPFAQYALNAIYEGCQLPFDRALNCEARYFAKAVCSKEAKLIARTSFFSVNELNAEATDAAEPNKYNIKRVGIVGAGMMGRGIALSSVLCGYEVYLIDKQFNILENAVAEIEVKINKRVSDKSISNAQADTFINAIYIGTSYENLNQCDIIIEAVYEDRKVKNEVIRNASNNLKPSGILASNTSTLPITGLAAASSIPSDFIGLHFFSPVEKMQLVEVIVGKETSSETLSLALHFVRSLEKTPIVVNDNRGFYTTRVFSSYIREGFEMLIGGVPPALIENVGRIAGMPLGPLACADEVGLDLLLQIVLQAEHDLATDLHDVTAQVVRIMVSQNNRLGKKSRTGFYTYHKDGSKQLWNGLGNIFPAKNLEYDIRILIHRLIYAQVIEAAKCLEEGIIKSPRDADVGSILGWGFAPFTGGTVSYIDYVGVKAFKAYSAELEKAHGPRFKLPQQLFDNLKKGIGCYD